jgi:hypothetical protein
VKIAIGVLLFMTWSPIRAAAQNCPNVDPTTGYPVVATAPAQPALNVTWLTAVASAAAYRWRVPSHSRNAYTGWDQLRTRTLPPEPRWADDWSPDARERVKVELVFYPGKQRTRGRVVTPSGNDQFDRTLSSIWDDPMPAAPAFPAVPSGVSGDSVVVALSLGAWPDSSRRGGIVRFAAVQTRIQVVPNTLRVATPSGMRGRVPRTTVKYDVTTAGSVDPASIEFLDGVDPELEDAIRTGLRAAQFRPPTSNCRPIVQSVVQTFGG